MPIKIFTWVRTANIPLKSLTLLVNQTPAKTREIPPTATKSTITCALSSAIMLITRKGNNIRVAAAVMASRILSSIVRCFILTVILN